MNEQSAITLEHWGIIGTDIRAVRAASVPSALGTYCTFDCIPIMQLPDYVYNHNVPGLPNPWYTSAIPESIIGVPQNDYQGVTKITFAKNANESFGTIYLKKADDSVYASQPVEPNYLTATEPVTGDANAKLQLGLVTYESGGGWASVFTVYSDINNLRTEQYPALKAFNYGVSISYSGMVDDWLEGQFDGKYYAGEPGGPGGEAGPSGSASGGGGLYTMPDYDIPHPSLPSLDPADSGFMSIYKMSSAQLQALASDLWDDNFFNSLAKHFSDPFDNIISLGIVPFNVVGTLQQVTICDYQCPTSGEKLASCYYQLDCGTIYMKHYFEHFGDYQIKFDLYLPYCGTISLDSSEIMDGSINIQYNFDIFSGACIATVRCFYEGGSSHVLYSKEGNIRTEIPISGRDFAEYYKGLITGIATIGVGSAIGIAGLAGVGGAIGGLAAGAGGFGAAAKGAMNLAFNKPAYQRSGNIGGPAGYMGIQYPYLIATIPNYFGGPEIGEKCGYVSNLPCRIGDQTGYLRSDIDFEELYGIKAPAPILNRIKDALAEGIYIEEVQ